MSQVSQAARALEPGALLHKAIPPRMVEPYLTGRRSIISGFVYRVADTRAYHPRDLYRLLGLGYDGSDFPADPAEIYLLSWRAIGTGSYRVPYSAEHGGDWAMPQPSTGTGFTAAGDELVAEYYTDPIPIPVGAEIYRMARGTSDFIARFDGQVWLRPAEGS